MRDWPYAREPFDFKLFVLLFLKKLWIVVCAMFIGTVLIGGGYYLKKVVFGGPTEYEITTTYFVEYNTYNNETGELYSYVNSATWGSLVVTDWFVDRAWEHALEAGLAPEKYDVEKSDLKNFFSATMPSDLRIPTSTVTTPIEELTERLENALQMTFADFAEEQPEIDDIRILDETPVAVSDKDVRTLRACILGALVGLFLAGFAVIFEIIRDDSIFLPETFTYRYGLPMAGFLGKDDMALAEDVLTNIKYLFRDSEKSMIVTIGQGIDAVKLLQILQDEDFVEVISSMDLDEECYTKLRGANGVLLGVEAGAGNAGEIEHVLHELQVQDISVQGALLCNADTKLIKAYRLGKGRR